MDDKVLESMVKDLMSGKTVEVNDSSLGEFVSYAVRSNGPLVLQMDKVGGQSETTLVRFHAFGGRLQDRP